MPQTITVNVTAEDIAKGECQDPYACPINHALRLLFPDFQDRYALRVGGLYVEFRKQCPSGVFRRIVDEVDLPAPAQDFIIVFDKAGSAGVKPFSFELELPDGLVPAPATAE